MPSTTLARSEAPRRGNRGADGKRKGPRHRADRNGDVKMDITMKGRGKIGKSTAPTGPKADLTARTSRSGTKGGILSGSAQSAILRHAASGDVTMKGPKSEFSKRGGLVELKITGWENSKASSAEDGGVSSLITWLEKKASSRLGSRARDVRVKKSRREGSELFISLPSEDAPAVIRMNTYGWAGVRINIERVGGAVSDAPESSETANTRALLRSVLERRYNFDTKLLDLSSLGQDEDLQKNHMFDKATTTSKIFPALMKVLEISFDTEAERNAAVTSVTLANNDLPDVSAVTSLSQTLTRLQNLDLSNNKIDKLSGLSSWKKRFPKLQHLILSGNPIEQNEPEYPSEIIKWYPNLRMLNSLQVRTEEDIKAKNQGTPLPFPIRTANFQDEGQIVENFIRTFFTGFDTDRAGLASFYYDDHSDFSFAVNTAAPRDPAAHERTEKQEWGDYIKNSRNLKRIAHLPARQNRHFQGPSSIAHAFSTMPATKHPDLASDARKWMIEAHMIPGVPDPTGASEAGVDGFMITVHGEFDEIQAKKKRSFDRTFIIGPGGSQGVRVANDMLTVRAYGGAQAFDPEIFETWTRGAATPTAPAAPQCAAPILPPGLTMEMAEQMVLELQKQTGMTVGYAKDCLEQVGWDFPKGLETFANVKASLPAEAFVQQG